MLIFYTKALIIKSERLIVSPFYWLKTLDQQYREVLLKHIFLNVFSLFLKKQEFPERTVTFFLFSHIIPFWDTLENMK